MEPVTHVLTGVCLARSGFNRKTAYATVIMAIAAELPDMDTVWSLRGPVEVLQHHRGITHTFVGLPFEAGLLVAAVWGVHAWRAKGKGLTQSPQSERSFAKGRSSGAPARWGWLYGCALVGLLSHLLLDWTNNYGVRPFFPFNPRWYEGSFVFIFDPVIFALLVGALVMPPLFGLVAGEVGAKRTPFRGQGWAIAALTGVVAWWGLRYVEHDRAVELAMGQSYAQPVMLPDVPDQALPTQSPSPTEAAPIYLPVQRALASPEPVNPFRWSAVMDFGPLYQLADIDVRRGDVTVGPTTYPKPADTPEVQAAERSPLGRAYLDWSPMPLVDVDPAYVGSSAGTVEAPLPAGETAVRFRDPRFMGGWLGRSGHPALTGVAIVDAQGKVIEQEMDGRKEQ